MNPPYHHIHNPPKPVSTRVRCPVCLEDVYSRGDIHPQCAVLQSESPRSKARGQVTPLLAEPVAGATEQQAEADAVVEPPTAMGMFEPDRSPI
jgi:hypothetical protein